MLPINIIRIRGYRNNKRTHMDIDRELLKPICGYTAAIFAFDNGFEAVTSYNYYNPILGERLTIRID